MTENVTDLYRHEPDPLKAECFVDGYTDLATRDEDPAAVLRATHNEAWTQLKSAVNAFIWEQTGYECDVLEMEVTGNRVIIRFPDLMDRATLMRMAELLNESNGVSAMASSRFSRLLLYFEC